MIVSKIKDGTEYKGLNDEIPYNSCVWTRRQVHGNVMLDNKVSLSSKVLKAFVSFITKEIGYDKIKKQVIIEGKVIMSAVYIADSAKKGFKKIEEDTVFMIDLPEKSTRDNYSASVYIEDAEFKIKDAETADYSVMLFASAFYL